MFGMPIFLLEKLEKSFFSTSSAYAGEKLPTERSFIPPLLGGRGHKCRPLGRQSVQRRRAGEQASQRQASPGGRIILRILSAGDYNPFSIIGGECTPLSSGEMRRSTLEWRIEK